MPCLDKRVHTSLRDRDLHRNLSLLRGLQSVVYVILRKEFFSPKWFAPFHRTHCCYCYWQDDFNTRLVSFQNIRISSRGSSSISDNRNSNYLFIFFTV